MGRDRSCRFRGEADSIRAMNILDLLADLRRRHHLARRRRFAEAPYPSALYRGLLERLKGDAGCRLLPFADTTTPDGRTARVRVRHDIDTAGCVANMTAMTALDAALGVPAAVYVRVDGEDYDPADARAGVERCRALGAEVGLHTACYVADDAPARFREEIDIFAACFGFAPTSFTMHGLGAFRAAQREAFCAAVIHRLPTYGMRFTDCRPEVRTYDYVFEDCHQATDGAAGANGAAGRTGRFLYDDFCAASGFLRRGRDHLVLTHPCYWRFDDASPSSAGG